MKRNLLLLSVMLFALSFTLSAQGQTTKSLFNGTNFDGWQFKAGNRENAWTVGRLTLNAPLPQDATAITVVPLREGATPPPAREGAATFFRSAFGSAMINNVGTDWRNTTPPKGVDIYTTEKFGDCTVKVEFLVLKGGNSGVYLMGEYEVQVADSFAKPTDRLGQGDVGAIYSAAAPTRNACGVPGTWQSFEIEFVAPKFDAGGNKTANGIFKRVVLNGVLIQENVEVAGPTDGSLTMKEAATGPLMFQGDHGPIAFRNVEIIVP